MVQIKWRRSDLKRLIKPQRVEKLRLVTGKHFSTIMIIVQKLYYNHLINFSMIFLLFFFVNFAPKGVVEIRN